jgi:hypothetical protein
MRIGGVETIGAHAALEMAALTTVGGVAAQTLGGVGLGFERVSNLEVSGVHEVTLNRLRITTLDLQPFGHVVAVVALRLTVALTAGLDL